MSELSPTSSRLVTLSDMGFDPNNLDEWIPTDVTNHVTSDVELEGIIYDLVADNEVVGLVHVIPMVTFDLPYENLVIHAIENNSEDAFNYLIEEFEDVLDPSFITDSRNRMNRDRLPVLSRRHIRRRRPNHRTPRTL